MRVHGSSLFGIAGVVSLLVLLGGCGDGDDRDDNAGTATSTGAGSGTESGAAPPGPRETCPLTASEVGDVLGIAVQQDTATCMFEPEPGINPTVLYVRQVSFACSEAVVNDPEFTLEPYDGLGVQAYASPEGGDLMVCTNPPFEINVNITPERDAILADPARASAAARASERAAAEALARLILGQQAGG
jgi:hypothetical protein